MHYWKMLLIIFTLSRYVYVQFLTKTNLKMYIDARSDEEIALLFDNAVPTFFESK